MTERPNIVLVMTDQQRMDSLTCYGNCFTVTPHTAGQPVTASAPGHSSSCGAYRPCYPHSPTRKDVVLAVQRGCGALGDGE